MIKIVSFKDFYNFFCVAHWFFTEPGFTVGEGEETAKPKTDSDEDEVSEDEAEQFVRMPTKRM